VQEHPAAHPQVIAVAGEDVLPGAADPRQVLELVRGEQAVASAQRLVLPDGLQQQIYDRRQPTARVRRAPARQPLRPRASSAPAEAETAGERRWLTS
jgi:hypothetical protein